MLTGSCLCGALKYEITGPLTFMAHCHCSRCRKQNGAPFATFAMLAPEHLRWVAGEGDVAAYAAPPGGPRRFCRHCGSPAPGVVPEMGVAFVAVGALDGDPGLRPQSHFFVGSRAPWYTITDDLPQHEHYSPDLVDAHPLPDPPAVEAPPGTAVGSCLCGEVAYELRNPVAMFQCHCSRCRRSRGSAHGANLFCKAEDFRWTRGEANVVDYKLPEAKRYGVAFCRQCGASVPRVGVAANIAVVPVSGLDTDPGVRPAAHIFVDSKAPWFEITDDLPRFPEGPPSFTPPRPPGG